MKLFRTVVRAAGIQLFSLEFHLQVDSLTFHKVSLTEHIQQCKLKSSGIQKGYKLVGIKFRGLYS
jgi:hypothetical protein